MGTSGDGAKGLLGSTCKVCVPSPQNDKSLTLRNYGELSNGERAALRYFMQSKAAELLPDFRVADCLRKIIPAAAGVPPVVEVVYSEKNERASLRNLQTCAGVWVCPVCAARISEGRRCEVEQAVEAAAKLGLSVVLVTLTARHNAGDKLPDLLDRFLEALRFMRNGKYYKRFKEEFGVVGQIRGLEATYGDVNGWHPHAHELMFLKGDYTNADVVEKLRAALWKFWSGGLAKFQLTALEEWGLDVRSDAQEIADYIAKHGYEPVRSKRWGVEHEITKSPSKMGKRAGRRTPFQLLSDYCDGDKKAGMLYQEYGVAFKGKSQVRFSGGLRKDLGVVVESDKELAAVDDPQWFVLASLTSSQWDVVLLAGKRTELIERASTGDLGALWSWLDTLSGMAAMSPFYDDKTRKNQAGAHMLRVGDDVTWFGKTDKGKRRRFFGRVVGTDSMRVRVGWLEDFRFKQWLPGSAVWRAVR